MSDKKRSDITLGEMQDECTRRKLNKYEVKCGGCPYDGICAPMPCDYKLTDPPRFNEQQMAFWRAWYNIGARNVTWSDKEVMYLVQDKPDVLTRQFGKITMVVGGEMGLSMETPLDLAELLGKDGAE